MILRNPCYSKIISQSIDTVFRNVYKIINLAIVHKTSISNIVHIYKRVHGRLKNHAMQSIYIFRFLKSKRETMILYLFLLATSTITTLAMEHVQLTTIPLLQTIEPSQFANQNSVTKNLFLSIIASDIAVMKASLRAGANINAQDRDGYTPLMHAAAKNCIDIVCVLLQSGASKTINAKNYVGNTALIYAAEKNHINIVILLLYYQADPNIQNNDGYTALMHTAENGHIYIAKLLLYAGADNTIAIQNKHNNTALAIAAQNGYTAIVKLLFKFFPSAADLPFIINTTNKENNSELASLLSNCLAAFIESQKIE